jgi:hypothetical protein
LVAPRSHLTDCRRSPVVRFVQQTPKTQENIAIANITDWSFAKKANEQLKG